MNITSKVGSRTKEKKCNVIETKYFQHNILYHIVKYTILADFVFFFF